MAAICRDTYWFWVVSICIVYNSAKWFPYGNHILDDIDFILYRYMESILDSHMWFSFFCTRTFIWLPYVETHIGFRWYPYVSYITQQHGFHIGIYRIYIVCTYAIQVFCTYRCRMRDIYLIWAVSIWIIYNLAIWFPHVIDDMDLYCIGIWNLYRIHMWFNIICHRTSIWLPYVQYSCFSM